MFTRECAECRAVLPLREFYRHPKGAGGFFHMCKECTKAKALRRHHEKMADPVWVEAERARNRDRMREKYPAQFQFVTQDAPEDVKRKARQITANAIRDGKLTRQPCEVCEGVPADAHHEDYYKPLAVTWLCRRHHAERHWQPLEKAS